MISYAQNGEDVVLARAFAGRPEGFYLDVGANDPTEDSVTRHFYDRGWRGVNIEPQLSYYQALCEARPRDTTLNIGIAAKAGTLTMHYVPRAPGMSTFSEEQAKLLADAGYELEQRELEVRPLDEVLEEHAGEVIDFLKVDVEGLEHEVLGGVDWSRWRPRVIVVETSPEEEPWERRLLDCGYRRVLWDGINLFFVREEDADELGPLLARPASVLDRYDPWLYVEQMDRGDAQRRRLLEAYFRLALNARGRPRRVPETDLAVVAAALARVLGRRPDVTKVYGIPPDTDLDGVVRWAARAAATPDEPAYSKLSPYRSLLEALAAHPTVAAVPGAARYAAAVRRRLGAVRRKSRAAR
ncbi:MAG: FkbM family methyltransferase [Mycobacteriales bacterium]